MADYLSTYNINFKGLSLGKHLFKFEIKNEFFAEFPESEIKNGNLTADVTLTKQNHLLEFRCLIDGTVEIQCDRCLEMFDLPTSYEGTLYVKIGAEQNIDNDEIVFLTEEEYEYNIAQYLYESICLSLPISRYHGLNGTDETSCDKEMLAHLYDGSETSSSNTDEEIDPRWAKLKELTDR